MSDLSKTELQRRTKIVVGDYGGILPMFEAFYLEAIKYAARSAIDAFDRYEAAIMQGNNAASAVANVHEALMHAGAVSRFFWPIRNDGITAARAVKLREAFGITDESPLFNRELRNALEHFDERLDGFLLDDTVGAIFPGPIVGSAELAEDELGHIFRLVDPQIDIFVLFGKKYEFEPIREAVNVVFHIADDCDARGGRLDIPSEAT